VTFWWVALGVGFWNLLEHNYVTAILIGAVCWIWGDFE